jgi:hypothetical protein
MALKKSFSGSSSGFREKRQRIVSGNMSSDTIFCITHYSRINMIIRKVNVIFLFSICQTIWIFLKPSMFLALFLYNDEQLYLDLNVYSK